MQLVGSASKQRSISLELVRRHMSKKHRDESDRKHWLWESIDTDVISELDDQWSANFLDPSSKRSPADAIANPDCSALHRQQLSAMNLEETRRLAVIFHDHSAMDTEIDDLALTSNWIRCTGWPSTSAGVNRRPLQIAKAQPGTDSVFTLETTEV